uniref:Uncharacterized protein n=1 Tax=Vespula pensylvanica TaxID=30213 RepID=A0A834UDI0_VESPE|nr:hypothetical protein H0235_002135 [Vespula pensylvanica]
MVEEWKSNLVPVNLILCGDESNSGRKHQKTVPDYPILPSWLTKQTFVILLSQDLTLKSITSIHSDNRSFIIYFGVFRSKSFKQDGRCVRGKVKEINPLNPEGVVKGGTLKVVSENDWKDEEDEEKERKRRRALAEVGRRGDGEHDRGTEEKGEEGGSPSCIHPYPSRGG